jgi:hypothetical protein
MSQATRRVRDAARDASSNDDLVREPEFAFPEELPASPLDRETLDEVASTQMGERWESTRRDAN